MVTIQWLVYMVVGCCVCFGVLFLLFSFMAKQKEDEIDASPMTLAHDRDWSEAISQKEIPYTSDDPDFLSTNRSTVPKKKLTKDERLALIKESAEKKSFDERLRNRGR